MFVLISHALAASCCVPAGGADPGFLASCERLGASLGAAGTYQTGTLAWDGRYVGRSGEGADMVSAGLGVQARPFDWVVLRLALPVALERQGPEWSFPVALDARIEPWSLQSTNAWAVLGPSFSVGASYLEGEISPSAGVSLEGSFPSGSWLVGGRAWWSQETLFYTGQLGIGILREKLDPSFFVGLSGDTTTTIAFAPFVGASLRYRIRPISRLVGTLSADLPIGYSTQTALTASLTWLRVFPVP